VCLCACNGKRLGRGFYGPSFDIHRTQIVVYRSDKTYSTSGVFEPVIDMAAIDVNASRSGDTPSACWVRTPSGFTVHIALHRATPAEMELEAVRRWHV
jgi:hypothetical protein